MIIKEIKILKHHGKQFVPDVTKSQLSPLFRGRPLIKTGIPEDLAEDLKNICPSQAISTKPFSIDLGKCVFCKECVFKGQGNIEFLNDYKTATNKREDLIIKEGNSNPIGIDKNIVRPEVRKLFKYALKMRQVSAGGDNSCEWELNASGNVNFDMGRFGFEFVASPRHADAVVVTGPITENMAEALLLTYDAMPTPKILILVGTDAISGGMFANGEAINRKFLEKIKPDLYVPGNPAHPLTFINGLLGLLR